MTANETWITCVQHPGSQLIWDSLHDCFICEDGLEEYELQETCKHTLARTKP